MSSKYKKYKGIMAFADDDYMGKFLTVMERLEESGAITEEECHLLYDARNFYFNALLEWLDNTPNVKIIIE